MQKRLSLTVCQRFGLFLLTLLLIASAAQAQAPESPPVKEVQIPADAFSLGDPAPSWVERIAIPPDTSKQPIVMRLDDTQFLAGTSPVFYLHRAIQVNDAGSLTAIGQLPIQFVPQYERVRLHAIHVLRGVERLDRTSSSTVRFLQSDTGLERGMYTDLVTASILISDLRVGDTLEYSYSIEGQNPVFDGKFAQSAGWDQSYPTIKRRSVVNYPAEKQIFWRVVGDVKNKPLVPKETIQDGMRRLEFEELSMPAVTSEPLTPPDFIPYRSLQFSEFPSWESVVTWASTLFRSEDASDSGVGEVVEKLKNLPTLEERVVGALEFVQSEIRYFSVALGESSHRPTPPSTVLKRRYGDCKDKSLLLITILKELGVPAAPVLLRVGSRKATEKLLPSPQVFDHVIVNTTLNGVDYYLDPARIAQQGKLSRMGQAHEGTQALLIAPQTRKLLTITTPNILDLVRADVLETAVIPKFGANGQLRVKQVWTGVAAENLRSYFQQAARDQIVKSVADALEQRYPGAKLVGEPEFKDDAVNTAFTIVANYDVPKLAIEKDGNWFVRYSPSNFRGVLVASPSATRIAPLDIPGFPYAAKYTLEIKFPPEVSVVSDPRSGSVKSKYFTYSATSSFRGANAKTALELKTLTDRVEVKDLQKFAEDLAATQNVAIGAVIVPKPFIKPTKGPAPAFAQLVRNRVQDTIKQTTAVIASGRLIGEELAQAYCGRAISLGHVGKLAEALRDANQAIKLAPKAAKLNACRGGVYFAMGDFEKSLADYSRAIELGASERGVFHDRGLSRFYAGQFSEAAEDFAKASASAESASQPYSDLWLIWSLQRAGKPLPDDLRERASAQPQGDWPKPALALMSGQMTPDDVLALLNGKTGDELQMTSAEAYFYLGQYYDLQGEKVKALDYFQKTRQLNVIIYNEHIAAQFEVKRLLKP